jgi:hypothetical protein
MRVSCMWKVISLLLFLRFFLCLESLIIRGLSGLFQFILLRVCWTSLILIFMFVIMSLHGYSNLETSQLFSILQIFSPLFSLFSSLGLSLIHINSLDIPLVPQTSFTCLHFLFFLFLIFKNLLYAIFSFSDLSSVIQICLWILLVSFSLQSLCFSAPDFLLSL